ncbi:hypothetical protein, partial [Cronobacter sakazakii]|uniref:hypothetical protein n=1 Tax=Cronobacter sakazakii TaxID=28141 RepID=UPI0020CB54F4
MPVVENGPEIILHKLSHFQWLADELTFRNNDVSFAPEDIPLGSCQSFFSHQRALINFPGLFLPRHIVVSAANRLGIG